MSSITSFETIILSKPASGVRLITLHRPHTFNALNGQVISELGRAFEHDQKDPEIQVVVITGSEQAFAAGADVQELAGFNFPTAYTVDFIQSWTDLSCFTKPVIAAVNGLAIGGGCEIAMMADILYVGDNAMFGQPEVQGAVIPGSGGTQRLTRAIGKSRAMEIVLAGRNFTAQEAFDWGLASKIFPTADVVNEAIKTAENIASQSPLALKAGKQAINESFESSLSAGLRTERTLFYALMGTEDQKEGLSAYIEKRKGTFTGK